ncbi:MAG: RDD family protein [Cyclobacteriaceae bacterium]|nr:RDD family protein [Cyclobacteriaceae bacterium]
MTDHHLSYCNHCTRKQFDIQRGVLCALTGEKPDFTGACPTFDAAAGVDMASVGVIKAVLPANASLGKRFANLIIDIIAYYIVVFILSFVIGFIMAFVAPEILDSIAEGETSFEVYAFAYLVYFLYYFLMENTFGRTLGKLVTGTRVVDLHGNKPTSGAIFRRTISRFVPFEQFSFLGSTPTGWHDRWTDTLVVDLKK